MSTRPLRKQLSWLLLGILLATTSTSQAQTNPCQLCQNGAICRQAYLSPGYICECQGDWQGQNCEQRFPGLSPATPKECGSNFYGDSGVIVSSNYPQPPNDNEDCYYLVRIPSAESITLRFDVFHSENFKDGMIIYPGTTVNDQLPDARTFIGTEQIAPQTFNTNQIVLYWYTDFNVPSGGFSIRYEADPDPCWVNPCQNGGTCNRIGGTGIGYQCTCLPDFSGVNCEIGTVIIAQTTISVSSGIPVVQGGLSQSFTFDLTFSPGQTQYSVTGTGLWSVTLFLRDSLGNQVATQNVILNNQQSSVSWQPPAASTIFTLQSTLNTNALSCAQTVSLCGRIGLGQNPSTTFSIRGVQGSNSLVGCTSVQCRGLEITRVEFGSSLRTLREGVVNQAIQFDFTAYSNPQAGQVSGTNLWKFTLFGSTQSNGLGGGRVLTRALTLNQGQLNAVPGPNGNIQFRGLETTLSLNGLTCSQVLYICVTLSKGDNPSPDFMMSGTPSDAVLTVCQLTTCRGVQVTDTSISVTSGNPLLERQPNTVGFTLSIFSSSSGGSVSGQNLFNIKTFGSNTQTGTSIRISERDVPGNIGITAGVLAVIPNLSTVLDLNNMLCQQVVALCTELSKGLNANPDFTLEPVQTTDALQDCINMECRGVYISSMTINPTANRQLLYGNRNHMLTFNLRIQADSPSASISGSNLWQLLVFANNQLDGQGSRRGQAVVTLTPSQMSMALNEGGQMNFINLQVTMDLSSVTSCAEIIYLCVQLNKGQAPSPDFTLQGNTVQCLNVECTSFNPCVSIPCQNNAVCSNTGNSYTCACSNGWTGTVCGTAVNACNNHRCENGAVCVNRQFNYECQCTFGWTGNLCQLVDSGVILSRIQLFFANLAIREGTANNNLNFNLILSSDASGQTVAGTGLWSFNVFGSTQLDGGGQRYGLAAAVYNSAQSTQLTAGGTLSINGVQVSLDLSQVVCSQVPYLCVEVVPGASASPAFRLSGDQVECAQINCQGVNIVNTQLQVVSSNIVLERDSSNPLTVDMTITTSPTSAGVSGIRLWRVTTFLSTRPDGSGAQFGQSILQLSDAQSGLNLIPGQAAVMSALSVTANAASLMCGQFGYVCARLEKSPISTVDFSLNSPSYVACAPVTCKGVEITDVVGAISSGVPVHSDTTNNIVEFDVTVSSNPNGASVNGANLWEVVVFTDSQLNGQGITVVQSNANLPGSSGSLFLQAGINMVIRGAQVSLNLNGISCNQIPYICVQLRKATNPSPDFTFTPVPSDDVLVHCQPLVCNACRGQNCLNGAVCVDVDPGLFRCDCMPGWTGTYCGIDNPCLPNNPCLNGGTCFADQNGIYSCTCINGFIGQNCHIAPNPCISFPCRNGGICERIGTGSDYECLCTFGFEGSFCETLLDPCNSSPCLNGGNCSGIDMTYVYQCQCTEEYEGINCQSRKNPCGNNPCLNGGVCIPVEFTNFQCSCTVGYTGTNCGSLLNPCASNPCLNNGRCSWGGTSIVYQCQCNPGYSGDNCGIFNICQNNPCQNGGVCTQAGTSFTCQCALGYTGNTCAQIINFCITNNNPCQNGGTCLSVGTGYRCQCLASYTGITCATFVINMCQNSPCQNGGVCTQAGTSFTCQCAQGYTGNTCAQVINFCITNNNPCQNGGTCFPVGTGYRCQCLASYTGNTCAVVIINACVSNPCLNNGACSQVSSGFQCQCQTGYGGTTCNVILNLCQNNPCQNGGVCSQAGASFTCQCAQGYTGNTCAQIINPCLNNPCLNGGACQSGTGATYTCQCLFGFSGLNCQIQTTGCASNPCTNGGQCSQVGTGYQCQCLPGYTGTRCNVFINPCNSNPCQNNGICNWLNPTFAYQCQCQPSYSGLNCEIVQDGCISTPCFNGATCRWLGTNFQCQCTPGYTGNLCSQTINPCSSNPCFNGGVCSWLSPNFIFRCQCPVGYTGVNCGSVVDACASSPCANGATCRLLGTNFQCQCAPGYTGNRCRQVLNPCDSNPCQNNGFCNWQSPNYAYQCQCSQTFTGNHCETPIGPCFSNPCVNGAQCFTSNSGAGYFCNCLGNFKGNNCQYPEPCSSNPCINNGDCNSPITGSSYTCTCLSNYQGLNCQFPNPCSSQPCQNGGLCSPNAFGTSFQCNCPSNYLGIFCQIGNPCISNPCLNGGACRTDTTGSRYFCNCVNNFIGSQCQFTNPCLSNPCQNGAICSQSNSGQTYTCSCTNGFFGVNCETPDPCRLSPCLNGGNCIITNGGFSYNCNCLQQYMGATCQYPNPCSSNPCQNGGICESHPLGISYTCSCQANFQGVNCNIRNPCASNPCINGGVCQLGLNGISFFCNCPQQYMGLRCENLNPCLQQPCQNGGACTPISQGLEYRCTCLPSYFGIVCENRDPCSSNPCLNGGVCSTTASGYFCSCPTGFNGINCNNMNPCGGNPCQNGGSCFESAAPNGFFCRCTSAYIGTTCTIPDLCSYEPCQNGGTCTNNPTGTDYSCECPFGYVGVRCEEFNPCISNPCRNGGTCNRDSQGTIYSCICVTGYAGTDCQFGPNCLSESDFRCTSGECIVQSRKCDSSSQCRDGSDEDNCQVACTALEFTCAPGVCISRDLVCNGINNCNNELDEQNCPSPCDSGPCRNGGACLNVGTSFICNCIFGWTGATCASQTTGSNDPPQFVDSIITINIPESTSAGSNVFHLDAIDSDSSSLTFNLHDNVAQQLFIVVPDGPNGAYLTLKQQLDREVQAVYDFVVSVTDGSNEVLHSGTLLLSDVNDNAPTFINLPNTTTVHENVNLGYNVFNVIANDPDTLFAKLIQYTISEDTPGPFSIDLYGGQIIVSGTLDYETDEVYNIKIIATDSATNSLSTESFLTINVVDVQDSGPEFLNTPYDKAIDEGTPVNTVVQQVVAVDRDTLNPNTITYSIISGNQGSFFALNPTTGEITVIRELDREDPNLPPSVEFNIRAMENGPGGGQSTFTTFNLVINDLDDEPPMFDQSVYSVSVSEAELPGFVLPVNIHVTDGEVMIQGNFRITLQNGNIVPFSVSPSSAVDQASVTLTLIRPLDYETTKVYNLQLLAEDSATSIATVVVTVTDANDNNPLFVNQIQPITLREGSLQNTPVITLTTTDADEGTNADTKYRITGGNQANLFAINAGTGVVTTTSNVDFENSAQTYTLTIEAYNTAPAVPPATGVSITTLVVSIEDINDNPPVFQPSFYNRTVYEDSDIGLTIVRVFASDADAGPAGDVRYSIVGGNVDGSFSINAQTGSVILLKRLDRETLDFYDIVIRAEDNVVPSQTATAHVTVHVGDANDNSPQWSRLQYSHSLFEGLPANTFVTQVSATDVDLGMNAKLQYYLATPSQYFWINQTTGQIYTSMPLDREQMESITLRVMVRDLGNPQRNSAQPAVVMVTILDVNDTPPTFTGIPYNFEVAENRPFGTFVGQATAQDPDTIGTLVYSMLSQTSNFFIDSSNGLITTINSLDREQLPSYEFEVQVTDGLHTATETVTVTVTDENDNDPVFIGGNLYQLTVEENMLSGLILRLQATDADEGLNSEIVYQFDPTSNPPLGLFYLEQVSGELRTTGFLDREVQDMYTLIVVARDRNGEPGGRSAVATVVITVTDVNDNKPYFDLQSYSQSVPEDIVQGGFITEVEAIDRDIGENAAILYRIIQGNEENHFSIDANGTITRGPVPLDRETKVFYQLTVEAYNAGDPQPRNTATVTITVTDVNDEAPVFTQDVYLRPDLMESALSGAQVATVLANDPDEGLGGEVLYSLSGADASYFFIDAHNGIITVQGSLPAFDVQQSYNLTVIATDRAQPFHSSTAIVMVHLVDAQDDPPEFTMDKYEVHLEENTGQGYPFLQVSAAITGKPSSVVTYSLGPNVNPIILELFELDATTGTLTTKRPIDYEAGQNLYTFNVLGESDGVLPGSTAVWVYIDDVNDNNPVFVNPQTDVTVVENLSPGFIFTLVTATDADSGQNGELIYSITGGNQMDHFEIVSDMSGATHIATSTSLDREAIQNYTLTITAVDKGDPARNSSININVHVGDVNDNAPMYDNQTINTASVVENILLNRPIGTIVFTDYDLPSSNNIEFYIDDMSNPNGIFQINSLGQITLTGSLDREMQAFYDLLVVMRDQTYNAGFSETTHFYINITDQNDNQPIFPPQPPVIVTEGPSSTGNIFVTVTAEDNDFGQNSNIIYTITGGNADGIFGIHENNGSIYVIKELDWESTKKYELIVTATDQAGNVNDRRTGTVTVTVNVEDINDTPPVFPLDYYGPYNFFEGVSGTYIGTFVASDSDSGLGGEITYTLIGNLSDLFYIHPQTGVLSLLPTAVLDYESVSDFNLTIIATDAGTPSFSGNTIVGINVLNINDHSPQFVGTPYRVSINDTAEMGSWVYNVMATDADSGPDGTITYSIFDGNTGEMFWINPMTGNVYVNKTLTNGVYVLIVKAKDNPLNPSNSKEVTGTLTILVTDSTSTVPVFINSGFFSADVYEHSTEGTYVSTVSVANPADVGELTYSISGPDATPFFINSVTGIITVNGVLDIEVKDRHIFEVTAIGQSGVSATGSVNVTILNINDYPPVIGQSFNFSVPEDATNDHFVGVVTATDQDYGSTTFHFSILSGGEDKFAINPDTGTITVSAVCRGDVCDETPLDREIQDLYTLNVQVSDLGSPLLSAQEVVSIHVTDVNDFRPAFDYSNIVVSVVENAMLNKPITTVHAIDQDLSASLIYVIKTVTATDMFGNTPTIDVSQWFSVNSTTGVVYVSGQLDRENASEVVLTISGEDTASSNAAISTTQPDATVTITITDINEHGPVFQPDGTTVIDTSVQEESAVGTIIINVEAIDPDNPINGVVTYMLTGNSSQYAYINPVTGQITVNKNIDRELLNWLNFTVVATDSGNPSLSTSIPISVQVLDVNDNNPVFSQLEYVTTVTENAGSGTIVIVTPATDKDDGQYGKITYKLTGGNGFFTINTDTGEITTLQSLDQEAQGVYTLTVTATDNEGGSDSRQNTTTVLVYVGDVNEHPPTVNPNFVFEVTENLPNRTLVGVIDATDADNPMETFNFTFTFANPSDGNTVFYIDQNTGEIFTNQQIDSDSSLFASNYTFTILVSDNGNPSKTTETTTTIHIKDLNDNNPVFINAPFNITISELFTGNVMTVTGQDVDKNSVLTYKIVNGNSNDTFFINPTTGVVTVSNRLDFESTKKYNLTILVEDQDGHSSTSHLVINIKDANDQTPVFVGPLPYQFDVYENVALGSDVGVIFATDADSDPTNSQLTYHITNNVPFTINEISGLIETSGMLDRETQDRYTLDVQVRNQGHTVATQVLINILDVNDNAPTFGGNDNITRSFPENSEGNFPIYQPSATDADIGENGHITYSIVSGNVENIFIIDPKTGSIVLSRPITTLTDLVHNFKLIIEARDNGTNKLYSNITLNMVVGDYNDNGPVFVFPNSTVLTLPENKPIGYIISSILATDRDTGTNGVVTYGFLNQDGTYFTIQPDGAGAILLSNFVADREEQDRYTLVLLASDGSDTNKRETPLELTILITDENDNEPFFIRVESTSILQLLNVTEHSSTGTSIGQVNKAVDLDLAPFNNVYYYIVGGNGNGTFRIDKNTGEIIVVGDLDRETAGFHNLIIKATNNATYVPSGIYDVTTDTTLKQVQIEVKDINDNGPLFNQKIYISSILTNAEEQTQVSCIMATDVDLGDSIDYTIQSVSYTLDGQVTTFDDTFYIEKGTGCIRSNKILTGVGAGGFFDISVVATDTSGKKDNANVRVFTLDDKQKVVLIVDGSREDVIKQQEELILVLKSITGGEVVIDDVTTYLDENGVLVPDRTMVTFHVIDPNTNSAIAAAEILRLIDINRVTINTLFQKYAVVEAFALGGGAGAAVFGILEAALLAIALLLFLGALIFIIILCCLQRRFLKKIHGNSPAVIYATRADADVKEAAAYQGSNPLWLESADSYPDDWPDSISLLGGGVNREYESQEASMDFFSDMQTEVARDALVMTALINDGSVHGQAAAGRVKTLSNGGAASNGRIASNGRLASGGVAASSGGFGGGAGRSGTGMSSTSTTQMSSSSARLADGIDGSGGTLTNRLNRDGSVTVNLNSGVQDGGYSGSGASYTYSSTGYGGSGPPTSGGQRLTNEKAHEIRQMLDEDESVEATFLDGAMYGNGDNSAGMAAARAVYREDVEFENQLSPITEEDTTSSWSSWTRDSERSGGRHTGGTLERNRTTGRSSKEYQDPMTNYTTSTSVEENYSHSVKKPSQTETSSYSRRANSKTYSAGVPTSIGMVTLTEETPEMISLDNDEDSDGESSVLGGKTYTYNVMGDNTSEGARSLSGASSGHSSSKRKETNMITQEDDDDDEDGDVIEETETRRSKKTTRAYTNSGYNDYMDEESRL